MHKKSLSSTDKQMRIRIRILLTFQMISPSIVFPEILYVPSPQRLSPSGVASISRQLSKSALGIITLYRSLTLYLIIDFARNDYPSSYGRHPGFFM